MILLSMILRGHRPIYFYLPASAFVKTTADKPAGPLRAEGRSESLTAKSFLQGE